MSPVPCCSCHRGGIARGGSRSYLRRVTDDLYVIWQNQDQSLLLCSSDPEPDYGYPTRCFRPSNAPPTGTCALTSSYPHDQPLTRGERERKPRPSERSVSISPSLEGGYTDSTSLIVHSLVLPLPTCPVPPCGVPSARPPPDGFTAGVSTCPTHDACAHGRDRLWDAK